MAQEEGPRKRGRPGITKEDVAEAASALRAQGRRIGQTNIWLELGRRGSRTTITTYMRELGLTDSVAPDGKKGSDDNV
jgi:hypothetical protein